MNKDSRIYVAGHNGMVGSAILRNLTAKGYTNLIHFSSSELDLRNQKAVEDFFDKYRPEFVFLAAAKVGGIQANNIYRAEFLYDNLAIEMNVIHQAYIHKVQKLLFLGSSCIYPKNAPQPLKEEYLLSGYLETTNEPYAIAKITGIKLCEAYRSQYGCNFISAMPTNLYGPNDNFDLQKSHVLPALLRKFHEAMTNGKKVVEVWGSGKPYREFLHVDDLAEACIFLMDNYDDGELINLGFGRDICIADLAQIIRKVVGYSGDIIYNTVMPDGTPCKQLDVSKITILGWLPRIGLEDGIRSTYQWYIKQDNDNNPSIDL